jgi:type IV secretory pathway component VirB8
VRERYVNSLYFLDRALFSQTDAQDRRTQWLPKFVASADDDAEVSVRNVVIENLQTEPYRARVEYTKIFTSTTGGELRRENWTAVFDFRFNAVANDFTLHNPLGLAIVSMRQDQAFMN